MEEKDYLEARLDCQISWYDDKSQFNKKWYMCLRILEVIAATSIPFLIALEPFFETIVGLLGVVIAVIASVISLFQFQENWIEYRTICESLRHEKYLFLTQTEPYNIEARFPLLVHRVESLISKENSTWSQHFRVQSKDERY